MAGDGNKILPAQAGIQAGDPNKPAGTYDSLKGTGGDYIAETNWTFLELPNEKVINSGDSYIVLGRDRTGGPASGRGGIGETNASSIDIVVGRLSVVKGDEISKKDSAGETQGETSMVNPDFRNDAARIHISQKTDIDKNNFLPYNPRTSIPKSGITIKADEVRTIARSGIKLVTSNDIVTSHNMKDSDKVGVHLVCGNLYDEEDGPDGEFNKAFDLVKGRHDLQPIPKGDNIRLALEDIAKQLDSLSGAFITFVNMQMEWNNFMAMHTHTENFYGLPGYPSKDMISPNVELNFEVLEKTINDIATFKMKYLNNFRNKYLSLGSDTYINSRFHRLN